LKPDGQTARNQVTDVIGKIFNTIRTGGANLRIEAKIREYDKVRAEYIKLSGEFQAVRKELLHSLSYLGRATKRGIRSLKRASSILQVNLGDVSLQAHHRLVTLPVIERVQTTVDHFETAVAAAGGLGVGAAAGVGSWTLVSAFGIASTGTPIVMLSGVAATNATLAWLGGGALAAGGGGMAAGVVTLGGLVAIPAVLFSAYFAHKEANRIIKEINPKIKEMSDAMAQFRSLNPKYSLGTKRANAVTQDVYRKSVACDELCILIRRQTVPFESFALSRWLFERLRPCRTGLHSQGLTMSLEGKALTLANAISQPVFDRDGDVSAGEELASLPRDTWRKLQPRNLNVIVAVLLLLHLAGLAIWFFART
jgi:hypothetical protein